MNTWLKAGGLTLLSVVLVAGVSGAQDQQATTPKQNDAATDKAKAEEAATRAKLEKTHLNNGNDAMHQAQAIREQLQTATGAEKATLLQKMNADYQTAVTEYQECLKDTRVANEEQIGDIGLLRLLRNGLISQDKAVEMVVQDKNLPVILSNLGIAYSSVGDYQDGIPLLQEAALTRPDPATYMQLGTDFAATGKFAEASATCEKIPVANPTATDMQSSCYKNVGIVLTNAGKLPDAVAPLQKATELNPKDALSWKLLGDSLSNAITTKTENGKLVYIIPPGTIEAYQKYLELQPNGAFAGQVKAVLDGFAQLPKPLNSGATRNMP